MRRIVALLFVATAACGLIGSTAGYSAMFCDTLDAATIFCDSFDLDASRWASIDAGGNNPITLSIEEGPKMAPVSPPNVLHVTVDGGGARGNRWRVPLDRTKLTGTLACTFDFVVLVTPQQQSLIAWLEVDDGNGTPLRGAGTVVGPSGVGAASCDFQADGGPGCSGSNTPPLDAGVWTTAAMTFTLTDAGLSNVTVDIENSNSKPSQKPLNIPFDSTLAVTVGIASDQPLTSGEVLIDNVFCQ